MTENESLSSDEMARPLEIVSSGGEIVLKQYTVADAEDAFALIERNRTHLTQFGDGTGRKYQTVEDFRKSITEPKNPQRKRFAICNKDGVLVGSINLTPDEDDPTKGEIGYYLGEEAEGKGYATRAVITLSDFAFNTLGYQTLWAKVFEKNTGSVRVLERSDYQVTGKEEHKVILSKSKPLL